MRYPAILSFALACSASLSACGGQKTEAQSGNIAMTVTEAGFEPDNLTVKKGQEVRLSITRKTDATCATEIIIKDPPINTKLPLNVPVEVKVTPPKEGDILFACAMNMIGGYIEVR